MTVSKNPFEFEAATNLPDDMIIDVYIEDYNYTRFIQSTRNIFLLGDRGSGKSMTLIYNSFKIRKLQAEKAQKKPAFEYIGVYIPCNTPLTHKKEYQLLEPFQAGVISEHYLVLSMAYMIADTLSHMVGALKLYDERNLRSELEYIFGESLPKVESFPDAIKVYVQAKLNRTQEMMNKRDYPFDEKLFSFSSIVLPLLNVIRRIPQLAQSHFLLMVDDAHDLNIYQRRALNSWIAYRDHSLYSFKVAAAKVSDMDYFTSSGGSILEHHDYIVIDMEGNFQSQYSRFGKLARDIIERRLERSAINKSAEDFFPSNSGFITDIEKCKEKVTNDANKKFPNGTKKQIEDYVYKFTRAEYFRQRSRRANRPPYSGIDTIIHLSTGVIRNLLEPCYWMYDDVFSKDRTVTEIPPSIQNDVITNMSQRLWNYLETELEKNIEDCSKDQAKKIYNLFNNLAILFRDRLLYHKSEPRAIVFTISGMTEQYENELKPLLDIARKAQLLYIRTGVAKSEAQQEVYYVPNRMLWPSRGLDPHGQHARVSLKALDLLNAIKGKKIPFSRVASDADAIQESMF